MDANSQRHTAEAAIAQAHWWAQRFGAALDVLYVLEEDDSGDAQTVTDAKDGPNLQAVLRDLSQVVERVVPELAHTAGVTPDAIRYYERLGARRRDGNGV